MSEKVVFSLQNPFKLKKVNTRRPPSVKYCAWEVLKDYLGGLSLVDLVKEIEGQDLRHFTSKNNTPSQIVSAELTKQKDYFLHDKERNLWSIRPEKLNNLEKAKNEDPKLVSAESSHDEETLAKTETKISPIKTRSQRNKEAKEKSWELKGKDKEGEREQAGEMSGDAKPEASHKRKSAQSSNPRPRKRVKGRAIVGVPVNVWWSGENKYFHGKIASHHKKTNTYDILYEDGNRDNGLEIRKQEIVLKGTEIQYINIDEHNLDYIHKTDEREHTAGDIDDNDKKEEDMEILEEEKDEKQA